MEGVVWPAGWGGPIEWEQSTGSLCARPSVTDNRTTSQRFHVEKATAHERASHDLPGDD
jgi:hypothetical protein